MFSISKMFEFDAAHRLSQLPESHKCSKIHGHNFKVKLEIHTEVLDNNGFVIDFGELTEFKNYINSKLDHAFIVNKDDIPVITFCKENPNLVKIFEFDEIPSAENLAKHLTFIAFKLYGNKIKKLKKIKVTVIETDNNEATHTLYIDYSGEH